LSTEPILKEEHRLSVSENKEVRKIFGCKERETPIPVAVLSKAWVYGSALFGIAGSNLAGSMNVSLL